MRWLACAALVLASCSSNSSDDTEVEADPNTAAKQTSIEAPAPPSVPTTAELERRCRDLGNGAACAEAELAELACFHGHVDSCTTKPKKVDFALDFDGDKSFTTAKVEDVYRRTVAECVDTNSVPSGELGTAEVAFEVNGAAPKDTRVTADVEALRTCLEALVPRWRFDTRVEAPVAVAFEISFPGTGVASKSAKALEAEAQAEVERYVNEIFADTGDDVGRYSDMSNDQDLGRVLDDIQPEPEVEKAHGGPHPGAGTKDTAP